MFFVTSTALGVMVRQKKFRTFKELPGNFSFLSGGSLKTLMTKLRTNCSSKAENKLWTLSFFAVHWRNILLCSIYKKLNKNSIAVVAGECQIKFE